MAARPVHAVLDCLFAGRRRAEDPFVVATTGFGFPGWAALVGVGLAEVEIAAFPDVLVDFAPGRRMGVSGLVLRGGLRGCFRRFDKVRRGMVGSATYMLLEVKRQNLLAEFDSWDEWK